MGDILLKGLDSTQSLTWGGKSLKKGEDRKAYLDALKKADTGDVAPLIEFSKG